MSSVVTARQSAGSRVGFSCNAAIDMKDDKPLTFLDVDRFDGRCFTQSLAGFCVVVIGAGPAGLVFARAASAHGADVLVLEQAGDPRRDDSGYTDRSFNITLDNVGRQVLGDPRAFQGGIWLTGRAIHEVREPDVVAYGSYGLTTDAAYVSIPRQQLRQNLVILAERAGARLIFDARTVSADCDKGEVAYIDGAHRTHQVLGDLIVFGDGLHSLANDKLHEFITIQPEAKAYFTGLIPAVASNGLSLKHIHFWHEPDGESYTVGIPNADGTVALLIASQFADIASDAHPFQTPEEAQKRLQHDFPSLYKQAPFLARQLPKHRRGKFWYKSTDRYQVGRKGIIVGDAACVVPPWAGYGANSAIYGAASLVFHLATRPDSTRDALRIYERQQIAMSQSLMEFVKDQGDFLCSEVAYNPSGRSEDALGCMIEQARLVTGGMV